jgi:hypothetical protein
LQSPEIARKRAFGSLRPALRSVSTADLSASGRIGIGAASSLEQVRKRSKGDFLDLHIVEVDGKLAVAQERSFAEKHLAGFGRLQAGDHRRCEGGIAELLLDPLPSLEVTVDLC